MGTRKLLQTVLPCLFAAAAFGQFKPVEPPPPEPGGGPVFSVKVNLVRLLVSVKDTNGAVVPGLNKEDFRLVDSGVPQDLALFERNTSLPLSVAVLIDTSGSTRIDLHYETQSILGFIGTLLDAGNPDDAFALFSFNWRTSLEADYSRNRKRAEHALRMLQGEGGTSLYDSIFLGSDTLMSREGRHVIVVVTDGGDTTSSKKYEDALRAAHLADAVLYPIVVLPIPGDAGRNTGGEHALSTLSASTGGRIFYPSSPKELDRAFSEIISELRTQYLLGFYPRDVKEAARRFHAVSVAVNPAGLKVSARSGYYEP